LRAGFELGKGRPSVRYGLSHKKQTVKGNPPTSPGREP
jgi:hypothetical protein